MNPAATGQATEAQERASLADWLAVLRWGSGFAVAVAGVPQGDDPSA